MQGHLVSHLDCGEPENRIDLRRGTEDMSLICAERLLTIAGAAVRAEEARYARGRYLTRIARFTIERPSAQLHR
jgi:hypothetical protein